VENCLLEAKYCHKCRDYIKQNVTLKAIAASIFIMQQVLFVCKKLFIEENRQLFLKTCFGMPMPSSV